MLTVEKKTWPSDGARNPVLTAPRSTSDSTGWKRAVSL